MIHIYPYLGTYHICKAKGQDKNYNSAKGNVQDCKFPFKQNGMQHTGCAPSLEKGKGPRCATEVDIEGNLKNWARCNKFCTEDPGMKIYHLFIDIVLSVKTDFQVLTLVNILD